MTMATPVNWRGLSRINVNGEAVLLH